MKPKTKSNTPFNVVKPSAKRLAFLDRWLKERTLDLALRDSASVPISDNTAPIASLAPKDWNVQEGDIRLLGKDCLNVPDRPLIYVVVLNLYDDEGMALIAPFSPYGAPASAGEWQTPYTAAPLRVLELWNARTAPLFRIAHSWRCQVMDIDGLATAREILRHTISGEVMPAELRDQTGLPIFLENDPRLVYQQEEILLLAPLTAAAQAVVEAPAITQSLVSWLNAQPPALALAAGTAKETRAEVFWLDRRKKRKWSGTARMVDCTPDAQGWQIDWKLDDPPADLPPGLPVHVCVKSTRHWQVVRSTFTSTDKKNVYRVIAHLPESAATAGEAIAAGASVRLVISTPKDA